MKARRQLEQLLLPMLLLLLLMVEDVAQPEAGREFRIHHNNVLTFLYIKHSVQYKNDLLSLYLGVYRCYHSAIRRNTDRV